MRTALFWVITQRVMVISGRRFGTTYRSHHHGSRIQIQILLDFFIFLDPWPLKIVPIVCPKTSVRNYYSLRNNSGKRSSHLLQGGSLQSRIYLMNLKLCFIFKQVHVFDVAIQVLSCWMKRLCRFWENKRKKTCYLLLTKGRIRLEFWMQIWKFNALRQIHAEEACYDCSDYSYSVFTIYLQGVSENAVQY